MTLVSTLGISASPKPRTTLVFRQSDNGRWTIGWQDSHGGRGCYWATPRDCETLDDIRTWFQAHREKNPHIEPASDARLASGEWVTL